MEKKLKILIKKPYKPAYVAEIDDDYKEMQKIVDGTIDCCELPIKEKGNIDILFDDEGLIKQSPGNVWLAGTGDCIKGTCFMVGFNPETGESISLTDEQIKICKKYVDTFEIPKGTDLYADYFSLVPEMYAKSEKYFKKSIAEM